MGTQKGPLSHSYLMVTGKVPSPPVSPSFPLQLCCFSSFCLPVGRGDRVQRRFLPQLCPHGAPSSPGPPQPTPSTCGQRLAPSHCVSARCPPPCCPHTRNQGSLGRLPVPSASKRLEAASGPAPEASAQTGRLARVAAPAGRSWKIPALPRPQGLVLPRGPPPPLSTPAGLFPDAVSAHVVLTGRALGNASAALGEGSWAYGGNRVCGTR